MVILSELVSENNDEIRNTGISTRYR